MIMSFGGMSYAMQYGAVLLGRLKCYGEEDVDVATSCSDRVAKEEDLAKIGTLRSCYEYSNHGLEMSGPYMVDPDGGLIGQEPFQVPWVFQYMHGI
jgi:hypothetical protein